MGFYATDVNLIELLMRVYSDPVPAGVLDTVYLFGETEDNQKSVLDRGAELYHTSTVKTVSILAQGPITGYPGFTAWTGRLVARGVPAHKIIGIPRGDVSHTHTEAIGIVRWAKKEEWKNIYVTAPPHHQFRAFINTVSIALAEYPELHIYSMPGAHLNWLTDVVHSQGVVRGQRREHVGQEWQRIITYHAKGDLASVEKVLLYLNERDRT